MKRKPWNERFRAYGVQLSVRRTALCVCGMRVGIDPIAHGQLGGKLCRLRPARGPWKYTADVMTAGWLIDPATLPPDLSRKFANLRQRAVRERASQFARVAPETWARIQDRILGSM